ncbi:MAG TPA: efflux transporter outer membrane subunit [Caulobacteraceae bacterium]|jgi:NodT family efflux transporter outer membrane factor (OMF) lipoprotein|nr:efflux transporter outer membrane subunit [Caulobacteraceae bacterium]
MLSRTALLASALIPALALGACAVGPNYKRPGVETPPAFKEAAGWTPAKPADGMNRGDWWSMFNDPVLDGLERKVNVSNQTLIADEAAYREARALVAQQRAALFPTVSLTGSATRSKQPGGGSQVTASGQVVNSRGAFNDFQAGLGATWAVDLWGQIRREIENAKAQAQVSEATLINARLTMQSELASDYVLLRIQDAQKELLRKTAEGYALSLKITQNQYAAGTAARSDVAEAETTLTNAQAALVDLETQRAADEHAIAVLSGQAPADLTITPDPNWKPVVPPTPVDLPSTLLQRRPDVAIAERNAAAANAEIGVAVSGYFPALTLTGNEGYASTVFAQVFNSSNNLWSLGANVSETVFNAGATGAKVRGAKAAYDEAVAQYRQAVLTAFQQVEDNLAADHVLQDEEPLRAQASASADTAERVTLNQYKAGTVAYTSVVVAEATALSARETLLTLQGQRMTTAISLVEALGGGWSGKLSDKL